MAVTLIWGTSQEVALTGKVAEQTVLHQAGLAEIGKAAAVQVSAEQDKRLATEQRATSEDQQHSLELSNEQRKQAALRDRLATADIRLSVLIDATDSVSGCNVPAGAVGVVHTGRRAHFDPAHAQRIIANR
jgi:hypothetical protein